MLNRNVCEHILTYRKAIPSEVIEVGDIVMLDPDTSYIKRAVVDRQRGNINSRLVVGVCVESNNVFPAPITIRGGSSTEIERVQLHGGYSDSIQTIMIIGGTSKQSEREFIKVAYMGEHLVNVCGFVDLGDKLCISKHPGKAKSIDYLDGDYFESRSIGKVIKFTSSKNKVKVLLDIE